MGETRGEGLAIPVLWEDINVANVFDGRQLPPGDDVVDDGRIQSTRHLPRREFKRAFVKVLN